MITLSVCPGGILMLLIVGLGNPGSQYTNTRHNVGFSTIFKLAQKIRISSTTTKFRSIIGKGSIAEERVILAQPLTYMNNSGEAVKEIVNYYNISREKLIIISDDLDLPLGKIRIKEKGSAGGHNGLKSVFNYLGTQNIPRIRIGIDSPPEGYSSIEYVLGHFSEEEKEIIDNTLDGIYLIIEEIIKNGYQSAMNRFN